MTARSSCDQHALQGFSDRNAPTVSADRRFFARHAGRRYRIRIASCAEVETLDLIGSACTTPAGLRWHVAIRKVVPELRLRSFFLAPVGTDVDQPEAECRRVYHLVAGLEWTEFGDRAALRVRAMS